MSALSTLRTAGVALLHRPGTGGGVPLLLLHGIGSDARSWEGLLGALDPAITAYAWDAPGYGDSDLLNVPSPAPADYAARVAAVLDALGLDSAAVVGHSLGCLFAGALAAHHPARVAAVAFLSPALGYHVPAGAPLPTGAQSRLDDLAALGPEGMAEKRAARLVHRPADKPAVLAGVRRAMGAVRPDGYAAAVRALAAGDLLTDAAAIKAPAMVAIGAEDVVTPPANANAVATVLSVPAHIIPDCGHALPQEASDTVARLIEAFLAEAAHGRR